VVDSVGVHGRPEVAELALVWHLAGTVGLAHVTGQGAARLVVLLTDTAHQHVHVVLVHLQHPDNKFKKQNTKTLYITAGWCELFFLYLFIKVLL
jgi:hypothetical protein